MKKPREAAGSGVRQPHGALLVLSQRLMAVLQIFQLFTNQYERNPA